MSYTRSFTRPVTVRYSGTVTYPPSKTGGVRSYSGTTVENVTVEVEVNTLPFDASVLHCTQQVTGLTASVVAMNAAQCMTIHDNTQKISKTIIDGFFHSVRTELSTQRAALEQTIAARLMLLRKQAELLREKRSTMERDYQRVSTRYMKIFDDLNDQLHRKIHQIDAPVFALVREVETQSARMLHTDLVQTAFTSERENSLAQAQIGVALMKRHAQTAMGQAQTFLLKQAKSTATLQSVAYSGATSATHCLPVVFMATQSAHSTQQTCHIAEALTQQLPHLSQQLTAQLQQQQFTKRSNNEQQQIASFLQAQIAQHLSQDDPHTQRVRQMLHRLIQL